jgi:hypothetical protein
MDTNNGHITFEGKAEAADLITTTSEEIQFELKKKEHAAKMSRQMTQEEFNA